jgi:TPR repeat protein
LASDGDLAAARVLGERYERGEGVPTDDRQALNWYKSAAIIPPAASFIYAPAVGKQPGFLVPVTSGLAAPGDPIAIAHLGVLYLSGRGAPLDEPRGRQLLACAAARGATLSHILHISNVIIGGS